MSISPIIYAYQSMSRPTTHAAIRQASLKQLAAGNSASSNMSVTVLDEQKYEGAGILRMQAPLGVFGETIDIKADIFGDTIRYALMPSSTLSGFHLKNDTNAVSRNELFKLASRRFFSETKCDFAYATENTDSNVPISLNDIRTDILTSNFILIRNPRNLSIEDELRDVESVTHGHVVRGPNFIELSVGPTPFATSAFSGYETEAREIITDFNAAVNQVVARILNEKKTDLVQHNRFSLSLLDDLLANNPAPNYWLN